MNTENQLQERILQLLLQEKVPLNLRQITDLLGAPPKEVSLALNTLLASEQLEIRSESELNGSFNYVLPPRPNKEAWGRFLSGHWTRTRPTTPGTYSVVGVDCGEPDGVRISQTLTVILLSTGTLYYTCSWGGWWWSEPLPKLPPLPK